MNRETPNKYVLILYAADMLGTALSLSLAAWLRETLPYGQPLGARWHGPSLGVYLMVIVIWTVIFRLLFAYDVNRILRLVSEAQTVLGAVVMSILVLAGALYLSYRDLPRLLFVYFFLIEMPMIVTGRIALRVAFKLQGAERVTEQRILLVGAGDVGERMAKLLADRAWMGLQVVGFLDDAHKIGQLVGGFPVLGGLDEAPGLIERRGIHEVIITLPLHAHKQLEKLVSVLNEMPVNIRMVPDLFPLAYLRLGIRVLGDMPFVTLKEPVLDGFTMLAKRALDLAVGTCALLLLWPVMLIIAVWIKLDSPGPVLFKQQRVGLHGRLFSICKFRTMRVDAEKNMEAIMEQTGDGRLYLRKDRPDARITRLGRHLRRWSLDELPQLFNVVKGEMSVVGPRPEMPFLVAEYEPVQRRRLSVPPGMTGWWQVTTRADEPLALHAEADLYYARNYSLLLDLRILGLTIGAVIKGRGAY